VVGVMVHGRDQDERVMLDVADRVALSRCPSYVLPPAAGGSWYTGRYFDPVAQLEPDVGWGIDAIEAAVVMATRAGVPHQRIVPCGFSQGACMLAELLARRPRPFAGAAALTGTLLGPPGQRATPSPVSGLPVYFASSRYDDWIPLEDVGRRGAGVRVSG
jgi:phospholipase/carboxylesterase